MEIMNEIKLSGRIVKVYPLRYTLAGLPIFSFVLEHESFQNENGSLRAVKCKMYCIVVNWNKNMVGSLEGSLVMVVGFLSQNSRSQIVLNVKQICE